MGYFDDNSVESDMVTNPADSRAKNRSNIVELQSADTSTNEPQVFSGDPIIEAKMRTNAEQQGKLMRVLKSSQPSGPMNQSSAEAPLVEYDVEQ